MEEIVNIHGLDWTNNGLGLYRLGLSPNSSLKKKYFPTQNIITINLNPSPKPEHESSQRVRVSLSSKPILSKTSPF